MLRRKETIQKSIRFDEKLAEDIEYLAKELGRTQNELVNIAVADLIEANKTYFAKLIIVDELYNIFENGHEEGEFSNDSLRVKIDYDSEKDEFSMNFEVLGRDGQVIDQDTGVYADIDKLYYVLTQLALIHIDFNSEEVQYYLKHRLDYK